MKLNQETCQKARLSRDARFDGRFFTAVKTTGIYCRSICPATPPKEANVDYYPTAHQAAQAGFRPCLRCRPDSAPHSAAWLGNQALLNRAIKLIHAGALENQSMTEFADYLGISDRYLRQLFEKHLGIAPKPYALYQQCLMAKQLLHQTRLPINQIAIACGFNSVRRFNDAFQNAMQLTPTQVRKSDVNTEKLVLKLSYRPPYDWPLMQNFLQSRLIDGLEQISDESYGRSFELNSCSGSFNAKHLPEAHAFAVSLKCNDLTQLRPLLNNIRRVLDLDTDISTIESHLNEQLPTDFKIHSGLRIPGIWSVFEAGIRAILGQQVSVQAAKNLVTQVVQELGKKTNDGGYFFPTAAAMASSDFAFIKMPGARKNTLKLLAQHFIDNPKEAENPDTWLALKGIGPWTVNYAKMRGQNDPDILLDGDLGVVKALKLNQQQTIDTAACAPWRSYLTFQLWQQLG